MSSNAMSRNLPLIAFPLAKLVLQLVNYRGYGMFRDEFYYLACADHLAWGYVDHPPFSILFLWIVKGLLGDSLLAVRLSPALAGAATVLLAGLIARRFGGGRAAQSLAMLAVLCAPVYLSLNHFYSMNAFDILLWGLAAYVMLTLLQEDDQRRWILLGVVLGIGLLNKISVLWLGFGLLVGLLATDRRRTLKTPGPWLAAGMAFALWVPHLVWQMTHGWPTVEFIRNATGNKMVQVTPLAFLESQVMMMNVLSLPLWLAGLVWLLFATEGRSYRLLGVVYLAVFGLLILSGTSRAGYLSPVYIWLLPAGAVAAERLLTRWRAAPLWACAVALAISGMLFAPFALPVLPVDTFIDYAKRMGIGPSTAERKELAELPQFYADMHGWEEIVETVAGVYHSLPPEEQEKAAIFTFNYGDAGAIDYLGRRRGRGAERGRSCWLWVTSARRWRRASSRSNSAPSSNAGAACRTKTTGRCGSPAAYAGHWTRPGLP
jgi:hypothetical protein